jgi:RecA/RadA recombinase
MARRKKNTSDTPIDISKLPPEAREEIFSLFKQDLGTIFEYEQNPDSEQNSQEFIKTSILPLDAILGGGFVSKNIIALTSPSETGKTTIAWQIIKNALDQYEYSFALYLDIEGSANISNPELNIKSRIELFNIDKNRVLYINKKFYLEELIDKILETIKRKADIDKVLGKSYPLIIVWDSISSTEVKKTEEASRPEEITGYDARMKQFAIAKIKKKLHEHNVLLIIIDQVRSNIDAGFFSSKQSASNSTKTGFFGEYKTSIGSTKIQHEIRQWLYLQRGSLIKPQDIPGIDGWYIRATVVKNKVAPTTNFEIEAVFDKRYGINKFWTEFLFLSEYQPFERRQYKDAQKFEKYYASVHPLGIIRMGGYYKLSYDSPIDGKTYEYPKNFRFNEAKKLYDEDQEFRQLFDTIVKHSVRDRIINQLSNIDLSEPTIIPEDIADDETS